MNIEYCTRRSLSWCSAPLNTLPRYHVAHADLPALAGDFALIEAVLMLAPHLLHEPRL
jgi:hypothetical protein